MALPPPPPVEADTGPIRVGGTIPEPQVLHRVLPTYTRAALIARIQDRVVLDTVIDAEGVIREVTVLQELPLGLTESAVAAVRQWRFSPSELDGRPVSVRYVLTVHFRLE